MIKYKNKFISYKINRKNKLSYSIKCRGAKCDSYGKIDILTGITIYNNNCEKEHLITIKSKAKFF